jgi:hypothetical protein
MAQNDKKALDNEIKTSAALKAALRLGHEAFAKGDLHSASLHILNNSGMLLKHGRACIARSKSNSVKIEAVSGQENVNHNSEYCVEMTDMLEELSDIDKIVLLDDDFFEQFKGNEKLEKAAAYFKENGETIVLVPLLKPGDESGDDKIFWVVEFYEKPSPASMNIINLLSMHYREALWYYSLDGKNIFSKLLRGHKYFSVRKVLAYLLIAFLIVCFFRISQNAAADFELIPYDEDVKYAPYAGIIESVSFKNGQEIKKGDIILKYDIQELSYRLMEAKTQHDEISAELDWVKQQSFSDKEQLGRVKILALKLQEKKIEIEKTQWFLDRAELKADISGILVLNESEKWKGKAVRAGEKLFEIIPPGKIDAEVMLNEKDASVLGPKTRISLYLHSMPEIPITGKIISVSPMPVLTDTGQFSYIIKMKLDKVRPGFIVGMRGVARVRGNKVSIGYYLLKNIVLWWRKV